MIGSWPDTTILIALVLLLRVRVLLQCWWKGCKALEVAFPDTLNFFRAYKRLLGM
jgi:hypothetical protein